MELLKIRTEHFEGPLDLLLFLIQKNEMDVSEISIHHITDQYVQYIEIMRELNFDVASEFLLMAATLVYLKSKRLLPESQLEALLPVSEGPALTEAELVRKLLEYKKYQKVAKDLSKQPLLYQDVFPRPNVAPPEKQMIWNELDITGLTLAFQEILRRARQRTHVIIREPLSIAECILRLAKILKPNEPTEFSSILSVEADRSEIVVTFVALLELTRLKKIQIFQNELFGSIYLILLESIDEFDPKLVTGFQYNVKRIEELAIHG